MSQKAISRI